MSAFLAFGLDLLAIVPDVARLLGIPEAQAGYGFLRLDHFCWRGRSRLNATVPVNLLGAWFGAVDVERLAELLVLSGVATRHGAELTYLPAAEYSRVAAARAEGGRSASQNLRRGALQPGAGATAPVGTPPQRGDTSVPSADGRGALSRGGAGGAGGSREEPVVSRLQPSATSQQHRTSTTGGGDHPREQTRASPPSVGEFWAFVVKARQAASMRVHVKPEGLAAWWRRACELTSPAAIRAGYEAFLRARYWREKGCPWEGLAKQWQSYAAEPDAPAAAPRCEVCGEADAVHVYERHLCRPHWAAVNAVAPAEYSAAVPFVAKWIAEVRA